MPGSPAVVLLKSVSLLVDLSQHLRLSSYCQPPPSVSTRGGSPKAFSSAQSPPEHTSHLISAKAARVASSRLVELDA